MKSWKTYRVPSNVEMALHFGGHDFIEKAFWSRRPQLAQKNYHNLRTVDECNEQYTSR